MNKKIIFFVCLIVLVSAVASPASKLFESGDILNLTLEYNVKEFAKDRGDSRSYHPAKLSYVDSTGSTVSLDVRIKTRGKLRRQFLKCQVPPYKMKFNKTQTKGTIFEKQKTIKLVTHCKKIPKYFQNYCLQEYLVYKMYNLLTEKSFRVRLAEITYVDAEKKDKSFINHAFFIESYKKMAKRNQGKTTKVESIKLHEADFATSALVSVFQYMIGNTDWSIRSGHNIEWITIGDSKKYYPIPFDFDLSGLIDADYARPAPELAIKSVRERLYRGFCKSMGQFNRTFVIFHRHKEGIYSLFRDFPLLPDKLKTRTLKYLDQFYKIILSPKLVKRYFIDNYRGRPFPKR